MSKHPFRVAIESGASQAQLEKLLALAQQNGLPSVDFWELPGAEPALQAAQA
jgi:hypothetical protein